MPRALRFVTFLAPNALPLFRFLTQHLAQKLGRPTELHPGSHYSQLTEADVAFVCGLAYVELVQRGEVNLEPIAAPVFRGERYGGRPVYFSDVIVRRDSPYRSLKDLRGRSWAYNEPLSHSGYGITRYWLVQRGETNGFFGRVVETGWHERSIRMVCAGEVDASAIDSHVLAIALRDHPQLAHHLRIIDQLGPTTVQPVVVSPHLPPELRANLQGSLLDLADDSSARPHLDRALVERFVPVSDASYDDVRAMRDACESVGFLHVC
jgi:phosphonate transport system substrate-binding protein